MGIFPRIPAYDGFIHPIGEKYGRVVGTYEMQNTCKPDRIVCDPHPLFLRRVQFRVMGR